MSDKPIVYSNRVPMSGVLYLGDGDDPWILLRVSEDFKRSVFDAIADESMVYDDGTAHISVFDGDEVQSVGNVDELGHVFRYYLKDIRQVNPEGWDDMELCWFVTVDSPELEELRSKYGLTPKLHGDHEFHITFAVKPKEVEKSLNLFYLNTFDYTCKKKGEYHG